MKHAFRDYDTNFKNLFMQYDLDLTLFLSQYLFLFYVNQNFCSLYIVSQFLKNEK